MKTYFTVDDHIEAFQQNKQKALILTRATSGMDFNKKPDSDTWSLGQILDHLNFVDGLYINLLNEKLSESNYHLPVGGEPFKHRLWVRLACAFFEPPYKIKLNVPGDNQPASDVERETTINQFEDHNEALIKCAEEGRRYNLGAIKIVSPLSDKIKLSTSEAFSFLATHQRRHLWQAHKVLERIDIGVDIGINDIK